jgi:hypothetical protein
MLVRLNFQSSFKGICKKDVRTEEINAACGKEMFNCTLVLKGDY